MNAPRTPRPRVAALAGLLAGLAVSAAAAADTVILKDGFVIQGNIRKEVTTINDPATGRTFPIVKDNGLDMIDDGAKVVIYSTHARQAGEVSPEAKLRPEYKAYTLTSTPRKRNDPLPAAMAPRDRDAAEFDAKWHRTLTVLVPGGFDKIEQQITYLDPYFCYVWSPTHIWRLGYRTAEMEPGKVKTLLSTHPELAEEKDKPDPAKRLAVVKFMLDAGWLVVARDDLDRIKKDFPAMPKAAQDVADNLAKEIDTATAALLIREAELAVHSGRYGWATTLFGAFDEKKAEAKQVARVTELMGELKATRERYDTGRRLLRALLDDVSGKGKAHPTLAVAGGPAMRVYPFKPLPTPLSTLADAAEEVYSELHPDSAGRIAFFVDLAAQADREKAQGRDPSKRPDELLATAVSGWAKGKNGATPDPAIALRLWAAREAVLGYQRKELQLERGEILANYKKNPPVKIDELAQIVSLLPPAKPENLLFRSGTPLTDRAGAPTGVYRRKTGETSLEPGGIPYLVKLPPEYHHGRAYPVLIVLTHPTVNPEQVLGSLANESDRHGYIMLAPEWAGAFGGKGNWGWKGEDHEYVTAVLADAVRHFCVDNDRVFLFGVAEGASMAMDVGASHPDLFAGVVAMGPSPRWPNFFMHYWQNAQKLPFFVVTGEMAGQAMKDLRSIYEKWMRYGFPSLMTVYKGRGSEWFAAETPVMFDWMGRKKRANGTATLRLDNGGPRFAWMTMRETDNRFYWLGADKIKPAHMIDNWKGGVFIPAELQGDIGGNNVIGVTTRGVTELSVWLSQDMIDWSKPVAVNVNGTTALDLAKKPWRSRVLEPDIDVLMEDYRQRGDRRMLYLQRLRFMANQ